MVAALGVWQSATGMSWPRPCRKLMPSSDSTNTPTSLIDSGRSWPVHGTQLTCHVIAAHYCRWRLRHAQQQRTPQPSPGTGSCVLRRWDRQAGPAYSVAGSTAVRRHR